MTTKSRTEGQIIRLTHRGRQVIVEPDDEDRFVMTAQNAVKACQDSKQRQEAIRTFKEGFLVPLLDWCRKFLDKVQACYVAAPTTFLQVFVIGKSQKYDFDLSEELSALELKLADTWRVSVLQLPATAPDDLQSFFNTEGAIEVYAELDAAQGQGQP